MKPMDDRGVSEALSFGLAMVMFLALMGGTVMTTKVYSEQHTSASTINRFQEQGELLAGRLQSMDRLVRESASDGTKRTTITLPKKIGGSYYDIKIYSPSDAATAPECGEPATAPDVGCIYFEAHTDFDQLATDQTSYYVLGPGMTVATTTVEGGQLRIEHSGPDTNPINITEATT